MDPIARMVAAGAAGAGGSSATYVDDLFSTALYTGNGNGAWNGGNNTVPSGLDFTEGDWLSWIKLRDGGDSHFMSDSTQKTGTMYDSLASDRSYGKQTGESTGISAVGTNSYTIDGQNAQVNGTDKKYVAWNFKTSPGFFDIVTWTGNATAGRTIAHNLGSVPGMILIKDLDTGYDWAVYHRSLPNTHHLRLNQNAAADNINNYWNNTTATSTHFTISDNGNVNYNGSNYVAYVFAHDDQSFGTNSDEAIIKCGSWNASGGAATINLGFEPQLVIVKCSSGQGAWLIFDSMRGMTVGGNDASLRIGTGDIEDSGSNFIDPTADGFKVSNLGASQTFVYMAIRRPNKPPEAATDVFAIDTAKATSPSPPQFTSGFVTDFAIRTFMSSGGLLTGSRLQGLFTLNPGHTTVEDRVWPATSLTWDFMDGWSKHDSDPADPNLFAYMFKRAPGFFDVVCYEGSSSAQNISHNLTVKPELILIKNRERAFNWEVYSSVTGITKYMQLNVAYGESSPTPQWNNTEPTATQFSVGTNAGGVNYNGDDHVAFLFASLSGISKIGSYTGTGNDINVNCGFSAGARFIMIHRTDPVAANWYVWDTTNGIVGGNDPYWTFATPTAAVTNTDYIDPLNAGFTVTSNAPTDLNAVGGNYLFLAIA